ncbi:MAG: PHP domain-containing protein [Acidobacteriota bacterium]
MTRPRRRGQAATEIVDRTMAIAGALQDMARAQPSRERQWGYKQAASAIRDLDRPIETYILPDGTLERIPHVGPSSTRIVLEMLERGESAIVDAAVVAAGRHADVTTHRAFRGNFLSRAAVTSILSERGADIVCQGDLQMHSTDSDGTQSLTDIVEGCLARGYRYAAVTDHSAGLPIANGLSLTRLRAQAREIAAINEQYAGRFTLLRGVEANIRADGVVDVPEDQRGELDIVVAAPHSGLRSVTPQTARMLAAVTAPGVHVLGHPRGRKYDSRLGVAADWPTVFKAAAGSRVAIELDGDPSRQDLDFSIAAEALACGCLFALSSDAHAVPQLAYTDTARAHAILAGIPPERIVNCWPLRSLLKWTRERRES